MKEFKNPNKARLLKFASLIIILLLFGWYVGRNWQSFSEIKLVEPFYLLLGALCVAATIFTVGMLTELAIEPHGSKLKRSEIFGLASLTRFSNYISPGYLGAIVRAMYLKRNYSLSYAAFSSSFAISNLIYFMVTGVVIMSVLVTNFNTSTSNDSRIVYFLLMALVVFAIILLFPLKKIISILERKGFEQKNKLSERLVVLIRGYVTVRSYSTLLYRIILWSFLTVAISGLFMIILYKSIGIELTIIQSVFIAALSSWGIIFSITPGSIGIREGMMVFGAKIIGVSVPGTLIAAVLLRIITFIVATMLAAYFAPKLLNISVIKIFSLKRNQDENTA